MRLLLLMLVLLVSLPSMAASEQEARETAKRIEALKDEIASVQRDIERQRSEQKELQQALRDSEKQISQVTGELRQLNNEIDGLGTDLDGLEEREAELERQVEASAGRVQEQLRAQYREGRQPQLQLMLTDRDPARVERLIYYYDQLNAQLIEQMQTYRTQLEALNATRSQAADTSAALFAKREELEAQQRNLESARQQRENNLAKLKSAMAQDQQRLSGLKKDQAQLQNLLEQIRESIRRSQLETANQDFDQLKGKLPWPVDGSIKRGFGQKVNDLAYEGVLIGARTGREVHAVHSGRVVFADWLRGYGLLLIIDHGGGYMSLYGHNESLLRDTGAWVRPGEVVATTGDSGGYDETGLYFAIRKGGRSIDPAPWLADR
ncbi:murein hydrolase activator EnvC family protein [Marinobacterium mangrovicola]|uniref:Septal ring factor EnvC (AmiA/AmiB activator) n=1 Tax=Marinobacterium mangrovicola TaxID=1476959 RepID=A0A4R1GP25_9GAMM|nr:peptidoglycan DD-metalloendopeptidase family protein [Marinobacterium mangrovicola]TCK06192.1 septal ring factor EnvC (AmiA/AmiB activator) [Marinobacterium mangrovicola]